MIKLMQNDKLFGNIEILENYARWIKAEVLPEYWDHWTGVDFVQALAAGIKSDPDTVRGYLMERMKSL